MRRKRNKNRTRSLTSVVEFADKRFAVVVRGGGAFVNPSTLKKTVLEKREQSCHDVEEISGNSVSVSNTVFFDCTSVRYLAEERLTPTTTRTTRRTTLFVL